MADIRYSGITPQRQELLKSRYTQFVERLNNVNAEPVKVYDPLSQKSLEEIYLIREVSAELQAKKDEDMKRAARATKEAEEKAKEAAKKQLAEEKAETDETTKE